MSLYVYAPVFLHRARTIKASTRKEVILMAIGWEYMTIYVSRARWNGDNSFKMWVRSPDGNASEGEEIDSPASSIILELNRLGNQGWELVAVEEERQVLGIQVGEELADSNPIVTKASLWRTKTYLLKRQFTRADS